MPSPLQVVKTIDYVQIYINIILIELEKNNKCQCLTFHCFFYLFSIVPVEKYRPKARPILQKRLRIFCTIGRTTIIAHSMFQMFTNNKFDIICSTTWNEFIG